MAPHDGRAAATGYHIVQKQRLIAGVGDQERVSDQFPNEIGAGIVYLSVQLHSGAQAVAGDGGGESVLRGRRGGAVQIRRVAHIGQCEQSEECGHECGYGCFFHIWGLYIICG
jgi:hypothetical protein